MNIQKLVKGKQAQGALVLTSLWFWKVVLFQHFLSLTDTHSSGNKHLWNKSVNGLVHRECNSCLIKLEELVSTCTFPLTTTISKTLQLYVVPDLLSPLSLHFTSRSTVDRQSLLASCVARSLGGWWCCFMELPTLRRRPTVVTCR